MQQMNNAIVKVGVLIQKGHKLLLIKERGWADKKYHWNIVKGSFDPKKDVDLFGTAKREAREEAGASIRIKNLLNILCLNKPPGVFIQFNFIADLIGSNVVIASKKKQKSYNPDEDIVELRFFSKTELKKMSKKEFIGERAYLSVQAWLQGKKYPTKLLRSIKNY